MPTMKLTDAFLRKVERPEKGVMRLWDTEIGGFVAHVQKTTTTLYYDRNNQRHLIGRFPTVTMPQAREAARELDYRLRRGFAKHVTRSNPTLCELVDQYVARPKLRSEKWKIFVRHAIENDLRWGKRRVTAGSPQVPASLKAQLKIGGRLVLPVGATPQIQRLLRVTRISETDYRSETLADVCFVPLLGREGWPVKGNGPVAAKGDAGRDPPDGRGTEAPDGAWFTSRC
jgi:hypothetical protein